MSLMLDIMILSYLYKNMHDLGIYFFMMKVLVDVYVVDYTCHVDV